MSASAKSPSDLSDHKSRARFFYKKRQAKRAANPLGCRLGKLIRELVELAPPSELGGLFRIILKKRNIQLQAKSEQKNNLGVPVLEDYKKYEELFSDSEKKEIEQLARRLNEEHSHFNYQPKIYGGNAHEVELRVTSLMYRIIWYLRNLTHFTYEIVHRAIVARIPELTKLANWLPPVDDLPDSYLEDATDRYLKIAGPAKLKKIQEKYFPVVESTRQEDLVNLGQVLTKLDQSADSIDLFFKKIEGAKQEPKPSTSLISYGPFGLAKSRQEAVAIVAAPLYMLGISNAELLYEGARLEDLYDLFRIRSLSRVPLTAKDLSNFAEVVTKLGRMRNENVDTLRRISSSLGNIASLPGARTFGDYVPNAISNVPVSRTIVPRTGFSGTRGHLASSEEKDA